jgi:hypothetical protein
VSSSRNSAAAAGWQGCRGPGAWIEDVPADARPASWLRPKTLWVSRNDIVAKYLYNPVDRGRRMWVELARARARETGADEDFVVRRGDGDNVSFMLLGDPGEGDYSQYAVPSALISQSEGADFTVFCSDAVYPTGDMGDYRKKFYVPYHRLRTPVFAIPGNHDWYDGLHGFMYHFCGLDAPEVPLGETRGLRGTLARKLWRASPRLVGDELASLSDLRTASAQILRPPQPAPYWAIDVGPVRVVGIDTGIVGAIDGEQASWLRRVSFVDERPKVLLTGKPIYVNARHRPGRIIGEKQTVDDVVRAPRANYVAAIGGDTHNYQRYPVTLPDGRTIQYVVSGGGGAYMHATHQIPPIKDLHGVTEEEFRCYPLRGDSLARFSQLYDGRLARGSGRLVLEPAEAATYLAGLFRLTPERENPVRLSRRARLAARLINPLPAAHGFHRFASEVFDWDEPPFFKQFLRVDVTARDLTVRCFGVTGCAGTETSPSVEDTFTIVF